MEKKVFIQLCEYQTHLEMSTLFSIFMKERNVEHICRSHLYCKWSQITSYFAKKLFIPHFDVTFWRRITLMWHNIKWRLWQIPQIVLQVSNSTLSHIKIYLFQVLCISIFLSWYNFMWSCHYMCIYLFRLLGNTQP